MNIEKRIALLIDGDCGLHGHYDDIITRASAYGKCYIKRIYGDFKKPTVEPWRQVAKEYSLRLVDVINYTSGKNSTDSALIVDAMELLLTDKFDLMCLVAGDSDYIRLIQKIQEEGKEVYGFGLEKSSQQYLVNACDKFEFIQVESKDDKSKSNKLSEKSKQELLLIAFDNTQNDNGLANLGEMKKYIHKIRPSFEHAGSFSKYVEESIIFQMKDKKQTTSLDEKEFLKWVFNSSKSKENKCELGKFKNQIIKYFKSYDYSEKTFSNHLKTIENFKIDNNNKVVTMK
ncbi:MAG: NYN domain-containing protein [Spirochaetales bacterium]|nr:NYN domain-containing protein [Spirochaetales bacterium]